MSAAGPTWNGRETASFAKYLQPGIQEPAAIREAPSSHDQPMRGAAAALQARGDVDPANLVALEALPIPAALIDPRGEVLGANQELLDILALDTGAAQPTIRLPLPDGGMPAVAGYLKGVQAGRVWLALRDGIMDLPVVAVGLGADGCMLYMITDASSRTAEPPVRVDLASRLASLTLRETQVLRLLIAGGSNKAVARELGISPRTVEVHRGRVLRKLEAKSLTQVIAVVIAAGLGGEPAPDADNERGRTAADAWRRQAGRAAAYALQVR